MAQQKLYTEEQVREMLSKTDIIVNGDFISHNDIIAFTTPIELLSDEEIENESDITYRQYPSNPKKMTDWKYGEDVNVHRKRKAFIKGAKWMRDKILNK